MCVCVRVCNSALCTLIPDAYSAKNLGLSQTTWAGTTSCRTLRTETLPSLPMSVFGSSIWHFFCTSFTRLSGSMHYSMLLMSRVKASGVWVSPCTV